MCPEFFFQSPLLLVLFWTAPNDSLCITSYIITLTNITEGNVSFMYETGSNSTSVGISGLTEGAAYFFIVGGIDTGNRMGEESLPSKVVTFDGKVIYCMQVMYCLLLWCFGKKAADL